MPKREDEFWVKQKEIKEPESPRDDPQYNGADEQREEENREEEQEHKDTGQNAESSSKSKAWFGNEYYDKQTRKWKKPGIKTRSIIASIVVLLVMVAVITLTLLYVFVLAKTVS